MCISPSLLDQLFRSPLSGATGDTCSGKVEVNRWQSPACPAATWGLKGRALRWVCSAQLSQFCWDHHKNRDGQPASAFLHFCRLVGGLACPCRSIPPSEGGGFCHHAVCGPHIPLLFLLLPLCWQLLSQCTRKPSLPKESLRVFIEEHDQVHPLHTANHWFPPRQLETARTAFPTPDPGFWAALGLLFPAAPHQWLLQRGIIPVPLKSQGQVGPEGWSWMVETMYHPHLIRQEVWPHEGWAWWSSWWWPHSC